MGRAGINTGSVGKFSVSARFNVELFNKLNYLLRFLGFINLFI